MSQTLVHLGLCQNTKLWLPPLRPHCWSTRVGQQWGQVREERAIVHHRAGDGILHCPVGDRAERLTRGHDD